MQKIGLVLFLLIPFGVNLAQTVNQSIPEDSARLEVLPFDSVSLEQAEKKFTFKKPQMLNKEFYAYTNGYPNPKASVRLSFLLPGAGQVYNKKYWKAPIVYIGLGGMIYLLHDSSTQYIVYKNAYKRSIQNLPFSHPILIQSGITSEAGLKAERDKYEKRRTLTYVGTFAVYGLFALEAFVDAHLQSFDISKDLSIQIQPSIQDYYQFPGLGIQLNVK